MNITNQGHCNLLVLSFVVHCSITVGKVLEFCKIMCNIVLILVFFSHFVIISVYINNWRCQQSLKFLECLSPGLLDQKNLKCLTKMWQRQHSTLHWGALCDRGVGWQKSQPALHRLCPTVIPGGTRVYLQPALVVWQLRLKRINKYHEIPSSCCSSQLQQFRLLILLHLIIWPFSWTFLACITFFFPFFPCQTSLKE